jgi:hypothetical protein
VRNSAFVRRQFPERTDTPDERSLGHAEIAAIRSVFPSSELHPFQLLCRLQNFFEIDDKWFHRLETLDRALLRRVRPARALCRYVVVVLGTDNASTSAARGAVA